MAPSPLQTNNAPKPWLPLLVAGALITLTVAVWYALNQQQHRQLHQVVDEQVNTVRTLIKNDLDNRTRALSRLALRWAVADGTPREVWEADVVRFLFDQPGFQAIQWADPALIIRWVLPLEGNEAAQNLLLTEQPGGAPAAARDSQRTTFSTPFNLSQGGRGTAIYVPIIRGDEFDGLIIGLLRIQEWLNIVVAAIPETEFSFSVSVAGEEVYQRSKQALPANEKWLRQAHFDLYDVQWSVQLWPTLQRVSAYGPGVVNLMLMTGLFMSGLIAFAFRMAQTARFRARQLQVEIVAHRQADEALRKNHELLEQRVGERTAELSAYLESAPDALLIVDQAGAVQLANAQAATLFGYDQAELQSMIIEQLLPKRFRGKHVKQRSGFFNRAETRSMGSGLELFALTKQGRELPIEVSLSPIETKTGRLVCAALRDVSERKQTDAKLQAATQQLQLAKEEAERANAAKSRFLATASHDLRQPLQSLNLLNSALCKSIDDSQAQKMLRMQGESLAGMSSLLNSLLDVSRLDAGGVIAQFGPVALQPVFARMQANFEQQAVRKGLQLNIQPTEHVVRGDADLLAQMLMNLVANAIRYTNHGSVTLCCDARGDERRIEVIDTGIGIATDQLPQIFDEFHQVGRDRQQRDEGLGLGLSIVQRIAELLNTEIEVTSEQGKGSTFAFTLPQSDAKAQQPLANDNAAQVKTGTTVLLVDDDPGVLESSKLLLEIEGFDVMTAASSTAAYQHIERLSTAPAIIVTDYHLGAGDTGIDVMRRIRQHFARSMPAILVTGDTSPTINDIGDDNMHVLNKPIQPEQLLELMHQLLEG